MKFKINQKVKWTFLNFNHFGIIIKIEEGKLPIVVKNSDGTNSKFSLEGGYIDGGKSILEIVE